MKVFKRVEEQKYVNRFRIKEKKAKNELEEYESPVSKRNKRLNVLFKKLFTDWKGQENERQEAELKEEVGKKMAKKKRILNSIETYFAKKTGIGPFDNVE